MIMRYYSDIKSSYHGLVEELAYGRTVGYDDVHPPPVDPLRWGVCAGFPKPVCIEIADVLLDEGLDTGMASYTKSRWTRFLRRYFRDDLAEWVDIAMEKLNRYPSRPFVASYSVNTETGHNYGGCLSSLQIRINPDPTVILFSRACQIDKIGFLDLCLIHVIAKRMGLPKIRGTWVINLGFISAVSEIFYIKRFNKSIEGHRLAKSMKRMTDVPYDDIKFGPLKRGRKRMEALDTHGMIPRSVLVSKLSIEKDVFSG